MATISTYPFVRHLRSSATSHVHHLAAGRPRHSVAGASFWFRPRTAVLSEIPVDDREQEVLVRVRTADVHEVTVPGTVTYRFADPAQTAGRVDFSIDSATGRWTENPLETVGAMVHGAASVAVTSALAGLDLRSVLTADGAHLAAQTVDRLRRDDRLASVGVEVIGVRFGVVRPDPELERAL